MAQYPIALGHTEAHERLTARVFIDPDGSGYVSLGNIIEYRYTPTRETIERRVAEKGYLLTDDEQIQTVKEAWEFTLDEEDAQTAQFLRLASQGADIDQAAESDGSATVSAVQPGRWYDIGVRRLTALTVTVDSAEKTEGVDYDVDLDAGMIYIRPDGSIAAESDLSITYSSEEYKAQTFTGVSQVRFAGPVIIQEFSAHDGAPLRDIRFTGLLIATAYPEQTGEYGRWTVRVTARTKPSVTKRYSLLSA